jgi:hypothetical protein
MIYLSFILIKLSFFLDKILSSHSTHQLYSRYSQLQSISTIYEQPFYAFIDPLSFLVISHLLHLIFIFNLVKFYSFDATLINSPQVIITFCLKILMVLEEFEFMRVYSLKIHSTSTILLQLHEFSTQNFFSLLNSTPVILNNCTIIAYISSQHEQIILIATLLHFQVSINELLK